MASSSTRPLSRGDVVLTHFPFTDLSATKRRPAVIVGSDPTMMDFTLVFISSQQVAHLNPGETAVLTTHPEFALTGLTVDSKIRAAKIVTLSRTLITRRLGLLGSQLLADLDRCLLTAMNIELAPYREEGLQAERNRLIALHAAGGTTALLTDL